MNNNIKMNKRSEEVITSQKTEKFKQFIIRATLKYKNKYDYSLVHYKGALLKVIIICRIHGEFEQSPSNHMKGEGCKKCRYIRNGLNSRLTQETFLKRAKAIHGDTYDY